MPGPPSNDGRAGLARHGAALAGQPAGFVDPGTGQSHVMTSEQYPVDEGTSAYQESLRPRRQSLPSTGATGDDVFDEDTTDEDRAHEDRMRRAGYDPDDVSGDTGAVRPQ